MSRVSTTPIQRYRVAILSLAAVCLLKLLFGAVIGSKTPFLLFLGAVTVSAFYGGVKSGVFAALSAGLIVDYFFLEPVYALSSTFDSLLQVTLFVGEGVLISLAIAIMQKAKRKAEAVRLRESEEKYRKLVELSPDAILIQQQGRIVFINPAGVELLGATNADQLLGRSVLEFIHADDQETAQARIRQVLEDQQPCLLSEERFVQLDGSQIEVEVVASPFVYQEQPAAQVIVRHIRERKQQNQRLQNALQQLSFHIENSPVALIEWDANFRVARWSRQAEQIFGWQANEVLGKKPNDWTFVFADDLSKIQAIVTQLQVGQEQQTISYNRNYTKTGAIIDCEWYNSALLDDSGNLVSVLSWILDITERKQAEAERNQLLAREQAARAEAEVQQNRLFSLFMQAPAFICTNRGPEHVFEFVNPLFHQLVGHRELIGKTVRQALPDLEGQGFFDLMDSVFLTGTPFIGNEIAAQFARQNDGSIAEGFFNFIYQPMHDANGAIEGVITFAFEVTEQVVARRHAEALAEDLKTQQLALRRSEARFSRIVESNIIGVIVAESDGAILEANDAFLEMVGYTREDLHNGVLRWSEMTPPEYTLLDQQALQELATHGSCTPFEKEYICKDGRRVPILLGAALLESEQPPCVCFVLDLSESKKVERLLRQQTEELSRANRLKDEFLATVSHELRTPLNAILGWASMLRTRKLDEAMMQRALETIERNARSQNQLINDLLDVSRIITGKLRLNVRPVILISVLEAAIDSIRPAAEAKNIRIQSILDPAAGPISGDPDRLQQVFWNLLSNAVKFTPREGRVQIRLERINSHVEVTVSDTGQGIRPEFLPYVFERLQQADSTTTRAHGGLGLGLAIVRHLVELHGGSVQAASAGEGQGATLTVSLPIAVFQAQSITSDRVHLTAIDEVPLADAPKLDGLKVLVVDDEIDARELLAALLKQSGAEVTAVASASEALAIITQSLPEQRPDVVVSDIGMPHEDGYMLIRKIRALPPEQGGKIPAIALTAYARTEDRIKALSSGFQSHVPKPVEPAEFFTVVANLVNRL